MRRYVATLFRGKWLYLFVLFLMLGGSGAGAYFLSTSYQSTARIWFDRPPLADINGQQQWEPTPAQQHGELLNQLLQTDSFMTAVIKKTSLGQTIPDGADAYSETIIQIRRQLGYGVLGSNAIVVYAIGDDPQLCQELVAGVVEQFRNWTLQSRLEQSDAETRYYQQQAKIYQQQVDDAKKRLDDFIAQHPDVNLNSASALLGELQGLQREYDNARSLYTTTTTKLAEVGVANSVYSGTEPSGFRILDPPVVPSRPTANLKRQLKFMLLGGIASIGVVVGAVILMTWQDRTLRTLDDAAALTGAPVLAAIPRLPQPKKKRRGRRRTGRAGAAVPLTLPAAEHAAPAVRPIVPRQTVQPDRGR